MTQKPSTSKNLYKTYFSPAGNRTPVSRVTGGDTNHYTTGDSYQFSCTIQPEDYAVSPICISKTRPSPLANRFPISGPQRYFSDLRNPHTTYSITVCSQQFLLPLQLALGFICYICWCQPDMFEMTVLNVVNEVWIRLPFVNSWIIIFYE